MKQKILVASPTYNRHRHLIEDYVAQFLGFSFQRKHLLLVEAGVEDNDLYYKELKSKLASEHSITVLKSTHSPSAIERLAYARNIIRQFASNYNFTHILFLDTVTFIPKDSIERLLSHEKDLAGFICMIRTKSGVPKICALKSGELLMVLNSEGNNNVKALDFVDANEILKQRPNLVKIYATAMSPLLVSRKVFESTPFRYIPSHPMGEDVAFHIENNQKGFEYFLDTMVTADHLQIGWEDVVKYA